MNFKRITKITDTVKAELDKLDGPELTKLIAECNNLSQTNCGWQMYGLKDIVIEMAKVQRGWLDSPQKAIRINEANRT